MVVSYAQVGGLLFYQGNLSISALAIMLRLSRCLMHLKANDGKGKVQKQRDMVQAFFLIFFCLLVTCNYPLT